MKHVSGITARPERLPTAKSQTSAVADDKNAIGLINDLFAALQAIFPAWKQAWDKPQMLGQAKVEWTQAIVQAGITEWSLIERGLGWARKQPTDFVPSVGKFIAACWPSAEELGLPDVDVAYWNAQRNSHPAIAGHEDWIHRAVYHAAIKCSRHSLLTLPAEVGRLKFAKHYDEILDRVRRGEVLAEPPLALPVSVHTKGDPKAARAALDNLRSIVGGEV